MGAVSGEDPPPSELYIYTLFVVLGWGTQWLSADALDQCMAIFMAKLPGGLNLRQVASSLVANVCSSVGVLLWMIIFGCGRTPTYRVYVAGGWVLVCASLLCVFVAAVGWTAVIGNTAVVVIVTVGIANLLGMMTYLVQMPMIAIFFSETCVSAVMTGAGMASLFAGLLGLVQSASPEGFGPSALLAFVVALCAASLYAWSHILRHGIGRRPASSNVSDEDKPVRARVTEASELLPTVAPAPVPRKILDSYTVSVLLMGALVNAQTWGFNFLQFATSKASCTCNTTDAAAQLTFQLATALAFLAMSFGGLLSYVAPSAELRIHAALTALHALAFIVQTLAAAGVRFMTCGTAAQAVVVLSNVVLRGVYQYLVATQYTALGRHFEATPELRERGVMVYGIVIACTSALCSLAAFALTQTGVISCGVAFNANAGLLLTGSGERNGRSTVRL